MSTKANGGSIAMSKKDLLLQLQAWIAEQLQLIETEDGQFQGSCSSAKREDASTMLDSVDEGPETTKNMDLLEQIRLQLCEQQRLLTVISESPSIRIKQDNMVGEVRAAAEGIASRPLALVFAEAEQKRIQDSGTEAASIDKGIPSHVKEQWDQLKTRVVKCCEERVAAWHAESEAYAMVLDFAEEHGDPVYKLAAEWVDLAAINTKLRQTLLVSEESVNKDLEMYFTYKPIKQLRRQIMEKEKAMKKLFELFPDRWLADEIAEHELQASFEGKSPGYYAVKYKNATEPCGKWAGRYVGLRFQNKCELCGLVGIDRTDNCLNYYQHWKWLDGLVKVYDYSEDFKKKSRSFNTRT